MRLEMPTIINKLFHRFVHTFGYSKEKVSLEIVWIYTVHPEPQYSPEVNPHPALHFEKMVAL